jgi:hypothetical protein
MTITSAGSTRSQAPVEPSIASPSHRNESRFGPALKASLRHQILGEDVPSGHSGVPERADRCATGASDNAGSGDASVGTAAQR